MKQNMKNYPPLNDLEGKTVEELFKLRQECRDIRNQWRIVINEEASAELLNLRRENVNSKRILDIQLNELKHQMEEIGAGMGDPAMRIKASDIRDKISELKCKFNVEQADRDFREAKLATERIRRRSQVQLEYENAEIKICKAIRDKGGFREFGFDENTSL